MSSSRLQHSLSLTLIFWALFSLALGKQDIIASSSTKGRSATIAAFPTGAQLTADAEDRLAWDEYASLVHPSGVNQPNSRIAPEWVLWKNKCEAGLGSSCQSISPHSDSDVRADASAAEVPRQLLLAFGDSLRKREDSTFVQRYLHAPQLASVLFNPEAAASIRKNNLGGRNLLDLGVEQLDGAGLTGANRRLPEGTFALGSEIVKLVWEIIPPSQELHLFDSAHVPVEQDGKQLFPVPAWDARYFINPDPKLSCPQILPSYGSEGNPVTVPMNCFYWFPVHGVKTCKSLGRDVIKVWCQPPLNNQDFYAVLVAFHVMKLTATNPDWLWMTFYWTKNTNDGETENGIHWAAPWNHFHEYSTTAIREQGPMSHQICFNPYLEGTDPNGVTANCLSCHTFAAYSPGGSKLSEGRQLGDTYPYSLSQRKRDENVYFAGSIQTALVWSISTNQDSSTQALSNAFESAAASAILDQLKVR
jgi:hypothetical protein